MDAASVLRLFDRQMRRDLTSADPDVQVERDSRTVVCFGADWSAVVWSDLDESTADEAVARTVERMRGLGREAEWKLYGHDRPADLAQRLEAAGLEPGDEEAVLVADLAELSLVVAPPDGIELRIAADADTVASYVAVHDQVFGGDHSAAGRALVRALDREPPRELGVVCFAAEGPVAAGRIEFNDRSDFASIWGGGTLPHWRGRGIYRATVAARARLACERGYRYLQVDALPTSRPILERLGFVQLTATTPYAIRGR